MSSVSKAESSARGDTPSVGASGIGREMAKGTGWTILSRLGVQGIGFVSTIILARLLVPADFGLVALATTFSGALAALSEFSFDVVLIQNQDASREHYDTAWTLGICRNLIIAACLLAGAGPIAALFGDARLEAVVRFLSLGAAIGGFYNIGVVDFRKDLTFHKDLIFNLLQKLGSFSITVPLAFLWHDYWALVAGIIGGGSLQVLLSYIMHGYRPRFTLARWREIMQFSKWLLMNNVCIFVYGRCDTFILGKLTGAQAVGLYNIGYEIATLTNANFLAPLRRAIFPAYAKVSEDSNGLTRAFIDVFAFVMLVGTPMSAGLGLVAEPLVHVMLGEQWTPSVPLIQILCLYGFLSLISAGSGPIFLAKGRPHYLMWVLGGSALIMIPLLVIGVHMAGTRGAAWAVTAGCGVGVIADLFLIVRLLHLRIRRLAAVSWRPYLATAAMVAVVTQAQAHWPVPQAIGGWSVLLAVLVAAGATTYLVAALILWTLSGRPGGAERHILATLAGSARRAFRA